MLAPTPWTAERDAEEDQIEGDAQTSREGNLPARPKAVN